MEKEFGINDAKTGTVIISKWLGSSLYRHAGIIAVEDGIPYVYDNDPDNLLNDKGGSIKRTSLEKYLLTKKVVQFYDTGMTGEEIREKVKKAWNKKFNWLRYNCEDFIEEVTGKPIDREVLHPYQTIGIGALALTVLTGLFIGLRR